MYIPEEVCIGIARNVGNPTGKYSVVNKNFFPTVTGLQITTDCYRLYVWKPGFL